MISTVPHSSLINRVVLILGIVCLLASFAGVILVRAHRIDNDLLAASAKEVAGTSVDRPKTRIAEKFGRLPLSFEINKGQIDPSVKFLSRGLGYDLFLTATEAVLRVQEPRNRQLDKLKEKTLARTTSEADVREGTVLRLKILGANSTLTWKVKRNYPAKSTTSSAMIQRSGVVIFLRTRKRISKTSIPESIWCITANSDSSSTT